MPNSAEIIPSEPEQVMLLRNVRLTASDPLQNNLLMNVFLNSEPVSLDANRKLIDLLQNHNFADKKGIAVAVNNKVIKKQDWATNTLSENDKVLVISATKGG